MGFVKMQQIKTVKKGKSNEKIKMGGEEEGIKK